MANSFSCSPSRAGARLSHLKLRGRRAPGEGEGRTTLAQRALTSVFSKLATLAVIAIAFFAALVGTIYISLRSPEVQVPEIVGKDINEAENILADAGLNVRRRARRYSAEVKADTVLDQTPGPGVAVKAGQTVAVVLSRAEAKEGESSVGISREDDEAEKKKAEEAKAEEAKAENRNENQNKPKPAANKNKNKNANNQNSNAGGNANATANSNLNTNLVTNGATPAATTTPAATPAPAATPPREPAERNTNTTPAPRNTNTSAGRETNANAAPARPRNTNTRNPAAGNRNSSPARNTNANRRPGTN